MKDLIDSVLKFRDERNRKQFHNPKDLASAIAIEAGELQEHFLRKSTDECRKKGKSTEVADEVADILVFLIQFADINGIDIKQAAINKLEKAALKYPVEKAKNSSRKYTEL